MKIYYVRIQISICLHRTNAYYKYVDVKHILITLFVIDCVGFTSLCSYVETDDDNNDETDRNPFFHFKDKGSFTSHAT